MKTLTIHRKLGDLKISINQGSVRKYTLMKEDCIILKFTLNENIPLRIGDYVDLTEYLPEGEHDDYTTKWFVIDEDYFPTYDKNTGGWKYDLQINAFYYMWKNKIFVYNGERSNAEAAVSLTDKINTHANMIVANLQSAGLTYFNDSESTFYCEVDTTLLEKGLKYIAYNGISILDAIKEIANAFECEWWVDRTAIHFGYRKNEDAEIPLEMNKEIDSASTSRANGTYATRLYAFGGTTNIPEKYGDALEFTVDKVDGDSVYDTKKPVYSNLFLNRNDDPIQSTVIGAQSQYGNALNDTYVNERVLSLGTFNFKAQNYKISVESFVPHIIITKIATHGSVDDSFNVNFSCSLRLKKGDKIVDISQAYPAINGKLSSLIDNKYTYDLDILDSRGGFFGEGGTFRDDFFKNEQINLYQWETGYQGCLLQTQIGYEHTNLSPFWATSDGSLVKNKTDAQSLTPRQEHRHNEFYSMYVSGLTQNVATWRGFYKEPSTVVAKGTTLNKYFEIWGARNFSNYVDIPEGGDYELQLYIKEIGTTNVVKYDNDRTPLLVFSADVPQFNVSFQRTAQSVDTKIQYKQDGKWIDADVTLNPDFLDNDNIGSSKIKFKDGNPIEIGTVFRFKEIIRSRVISNGYGHYFTPYSTNNLKSGVVQRNLMLPEGVKYVDANENINDGNAVELIVKYDWIYPSTIRTVTVAPEPDNGNYYVWIDVADYSEEMIAKDSTLKAKFQSGDSSGLTYELEYIEKNSNGSQSKFRLVPNNDWGDQIPNNVVAPKVGDTLILEGVNIEFFDSNAVGDAEERLKTQAEKDIKELSKANVVIDITLRPDYAYNAKLQLGQLVNIKNAIETEYHSRIIGFEEKLDYHYDHPKYAIGDANYYSVIGNIDSKVTEIQKESAALNGINGGNRIKIITSLDNSTRPSDANVHSAKRVERCFLRKDIDDVVEGNTTFEKNISVKGNAEIDTLVVSKDSKVIGNSEVAGNSSVAGSQTIEKDSRTRGDHHVEGALIINDGDEDESAIVIGDYIEQGDIIQGARISKKGIASFAAVKTPSLQVYELTYNRKTAVQGEFIFSDGDTVEDVRYIDLDGVEHTPQEVSYKEYSPYQIDENGSYILNGDGRKVPNFKCIKLLLKTPYEGYITTFKDYDILYSNINNIGASGESATTGKCFMRVITADEVNEMGIVPSEEKNILYVTLYDDMDVPSRVNMLPAPWMDITRHGNTTNTKRQDMFIISSEERRLAQLVGVNSPIISYDTMYGIVLGELPDVLYEYVIKAGYSYLDKNKPYLYAQGAIIEDLILIDYKGKVIKNQRFRGIWDKDVAESKDNKYRVTETTYDTVSHNGSLWQCNADETTEEPHAGSNDWILIVAKGDSFRENLLNNTSQFNLNWTLYNRTQIVDGFSGNKGLYRSNRSAGDIAYQYITGSQSVGSDKVSPNEWYTLSFYVKGYTAVSVNIGVMNEDGVVTGGVVNEDNNIVVDGVYTSGSSTVAFDVDSEDGWTRHTISFLAAETVSSNAVILFSAPKGSSSITISTPKLELGKEATQWTANANDLSSSIVSELVRYATSDNGTTIPEDGWEEVFPQNVDGSYVWTWTQVTYSTGQETNTYSVSRVGIDGKGIQSAVVTYCERPNTDIKPEDFVKEFGEDIWGDFPTSLTDGYWLYSRTITTYSDGDSSTSYAVTQNGQGSYYAGLQEYYAVYNLSDKAPSGYPKYNVEGSYANGVEIFAETPKVGLLWSTERPEATSKYPYLWNFSISYDSSGTAYVTRPLVIGNFAKGLGSIVETYAISAYSKPNAGGDYPSDITEWVDEHQDAAPTEEKPYQWNKTETTYNDNSVETIYHVSAVKGNRGRGIKNIIYEYLVTTTGTQPELSDSGWSPDRPDVKAGEYLWTKTITDYTDGTQNDEVNVTVSRVSVDGTSVTTTGTHYAESESGTDIPDDNDWGETIPSVAEGNYLWTRITFSDDNKAYSVSKDGESLTITSIKYSTEFTEKQPEDDTFDLEVPPSGTKGGYVWSLTIYSDGTRDYSKSYVPLDGNNGNDAPATNPNILLNTNFDVVEGNNLSAWYVYPDKTKLISKDRVVINGYGFLNSITCNTSGHIISQDLNFTFKKGDIITISCVAKSDSTEARGIGILIRLPNADGKYDGDAWKASWEWSGMEGLIDTAIGWQDEDKSTARIDVPFRTSSDWRERRLTLQYKGEEDFNQAIIHFYSWNPSYGEISQIKVERGAVVTPYLKAQDDLMGLGIKSVSTEYAVTDTFSQPKVDSEEWEQEYPTSIPDGSYLWIKTVTDYTDKSDTVTISVSKVGSEGTSVTVTEVAYAVNESPTVYPSNESDWKTETEEGKLPVAAGEGEYLWTRVTFSDDTKEYTTSYNGKSLTIKSIWYAVSDTNEQPDDNKFIHATPPKPEKKKYIWTRTEYSDGKVDYASAYIPDDGVGVSNIFMKYAVTDTYEVPTSWLDKRPTVAEGQYLWTKTVVDYTDSKKGDEVGITVSRVGANGDSITVVGTDYAISKDGVNKPTDENVWAEQPSKALEEDEYLWTRTKFSEGPPMYTVSRNGDSLKIDTIRYSNPTTESSNPEKLAYNNTTIPSAVKGKYIWTKIVYSDKNVEYYSTYTPLDGEDVIFADLSNEIDSIPLDNNGYTQTDDELKTIVSVYKGTKTSTITKLLVNNKDVDSKIGEWLNIHITKSSDGSPTGEIKFNVIKGKLATERVSIPISVAANNVTRNLTFTIVGVKAASNGESPTIYRLSVDSSQIVKLKNGTTFPSSLSVKRYKITGDERVIITGVDDPVTYIVDDVNKGAWTGSYDLGTVENYIQFTFHEEVETLYVVRDGADAGNTYTLLATPDTIYINKNGAVSSDTISLSVVETTPHGSATITSKDDLTNKELEIKYKISGNTDLKSVDSLSLELNKLFGSGEYKPIDFALYHDKKIVFTKTVGFSREGKDGETPITLHSSPSTVNILRSAQEKEYLGEKEHKIEVFARDSYGIKYTTDYTIVASNDSKDSYTATANYDEENDKYYVTVTFKKDVIDVQPDPVSVSFTSKDGKDWGTLLVPISISERGIVGPQGTSGAMIQPYGKWIEGTAYNLERNEKTGEVIGKPCVYHIAAGAEQGVYYVLEKDADAGVRIDENDYWTPMTKIAYIYSDAIMANWAKFGSDKGAVFYDRYLFSQYGVTKDGLFDHFSNHQGENGMWDENGGLSGKFTPSLFIDMYSGTTKSDKFAETLQEYRYSDANGDLFANEIRFYETYNVKYEPLISWEGNNDNLSSSPRLLTMPLANNITNGNGEILVEAQHDAELDGIKSNIIARANRGWSRKKEGTFKTITGVTPFEDIAQLSSCSLILCADPRLLNPYAWRKQGDSVFNPSLLVDDGWSVPQEIGRFVIDSKLTDFILLEAGKQIRLRSCKSGDVLYWYVENSEDFKEVPYEVYYYTDTIYDVDNDSIVKGDFSHQVGYGNEGVVNEYYRRTFASTSIAKYYDERVKNGVAMSVTINASSNAGEDGWNWEQDITNIEIKSV